jgi:hypothetical protein
MKKTGSKNVIAEKESIKNIEILTNMFKRKRLTSDEYIRMVNQNLAKITDERD